MPRRRDGRIAAGKPIEEQRPKGASMANNNDGTNGHSKSSVKLAIASIGVVFGDIGTSPLYAMREALHPVVSAGGDLRAAVLGVASLLIWALVLIVTLKYVILLMR